MTLKPYLWRHIMVLLVTHLLFSGTALAFEDDSGCLICHKYPKMGRVTEEGIRRSYFVSPHIYGSTVHRNVPCTDCHNYIKQLPHREVTTGVTCDTECHSVKNPATGKNFSHKPIMETYLDSSHGRGKDAEGLDLDKPYCVTCHQNPRYDPKEKAPPERIVKRCVVCHEDNKFVSTWYKHTSRRIREVKRSSEEVVALCSSCHGDKNFISRHMADAEKKDRPLGRKFAFAVDSYNESFHGKVTRYGFRKAANCLDCHADADNYYMSVHRILPSTDPQSPVNEKNKVNTCKRCHKNANANYAALDPHPTKDKQDNPFSYYAEIAYNWIGDVVLVLLVSMALFETIGRRRDGVSWRLIRGSSWWRKSKRKNRNRIN